MPDIQQEEIKFEKRKKQNTRNRPRAAPRAKKSEVREERQSLHSKYTNNNWLAVYR